MSEPRICFEKILPADLAVDLPPADAHGNVPARAAIWNAKKWDNGSTLTFSFLEGSSSQQSQVIQFATEWLRYANLKFDFNDSPDAMIRISFDPSIGSWSYVGKDSLDIASHEATMNFAWLDKAVVLHEFGHALGLIHEHQNPDGGIQWNRPKVIQALSAGPNFWGIDTIERNIFQKYSTNIINGTVLDPDSIMMYPFPNEWTTGDFQTVKNLELSDLDKEFIASADGYPED